MTTKSRHGGPRKNSGHTKSKAEKILLAGFNADWFTPALQRTKWTEFLNSTDQKIALDAAKYLSDRVFGKAHQTVDTTLNGELQLKLAERIAQARKR